MQKAKCLHNSANHGIQNSKLWYLKQRSSHWLYPRYSSFSVIIGETVITATGTKCDISVGW